MIDTLPKKPTLNDIQKYVSAWKKSRGFNVTDPVLEMMYLTEEVGELASAVRRSKKVKKGLWDINKNHDEKVGDEIADVIHFLLNIAEMYKIDMNETFRRKAQENQDRVWIKMKDKKD